MQYSRRFTQFIYLFIIILAAWLISPVVVGGNDPEAARQAWPMIQNGALLIDVRSKEEFAEGHLEGAINISWDDFDALMSAIGDDKQRPVVFYCRSGNRAGKSITKLAEHGYINIFNATGLKALIETKP
jgi:phage shock protein E